MDCDTTGIEPDFAIVKFKKLAGGGYFKIINRTVPEALGRSVTTTAEIDDIVRYAVGHGTLAGRAGGSITRRLKEEGLHRDPRWRPSRRRARQRLRHQVRLQQVDPGRAISAPSDPGLHRLEPARRCLGFDMLAALGFTKSGGRAGQIYCCGAMTLEGAPHLKAEHLPVFDCANPCGQKGTRSSRPRATSA